VQLTTFVDRDIFAGYETLFSEVKPDLIRHMVRGIIMERPAATWTMNQMTMVVLLAGP